MIIIIGSTACILLCFEESIEEKEEQMQEMMMKFTEVSENIGIQFQETQSSDRQGFISKLKAQTEDFVTFLFFFYQQK